MNIVVMTMHKRQGWRSLWRRQQFVWSVSESEVWSELLLMQARHGEKIRSIQIYPHRENVL